MSGYIYPEKDRPKVEDILGSCYQYDNDMIENMLEVRVIRRYDVYNQSNHPHMPPKFKKYKYISEIYELENGKWLGFNENYSRGFSWVASGKPRKKKEDQ